MAKNENEQFGSIDRIDDVRKELAEKIDGKLSHTMFFSILGILVVILIGIVTFLINQIADIRTKYEDLIQKVTKIEAKSEYGKK